MTKPRASGISAFCTLGAPRSGAGRGVRPPAFCRTFLLSVCSGLLILLPQPLFAQQGGEGSSAATQNIVVKSGALLTRHKFAVDVSGAPVDAEFEGLHRSPDGQISTVKAGSWRWLESGRHRIEWRLSTEKSADQGRAPSVVQTIDILPRVEFASSGAALHPSRSTQKVFRGWPALVEVVLTGSAPEAVVSVPLRVEGPFSAKILEQLETTTITVGDAGRALLKLDIAEVPVGGFVDLVMGHPLNAVQGEIFRHRLQVVADGFSSTQFFRLTLRQNQRVVHALRGNAYASLEAQPAATEVLLDFAAGSFDWDVRYVDSEGFEMHLFDVPAAGGAKSDALFERLRLPPEPGVLKVKVRFSLGGDVSLVREAEFPVLPAIGFSHASPPGFGESPEKNGGHYSGPLPPWLLPLGPPFADAGKLPPGSVGHAVADWQHSDFHRCQGGFS